MSDNKGVSTLNRLIRICKDGEQGFRVASESVRNRGLKTLFKSYAHQRSQFATELQSEVERLGGKPRVKGSFLAGLHRGWIDIKAAMTIGQQKTEQVVLSESQRGEKLAARTFRDALEQSLPSETREIVARQVEDIQQVGDWIERMLGRSGRRMVVRLFDQESDAQKAIEELQKRGFGDDDIRELAIDDTISVYEGEETGSTIGESASAGALGGTILGIFIGLAAGIATVFVPGMDLGMEMGFPEAIIVVAVAGAGFGAAIGALIGAIIGQGISEEDTYLYAHSIDRGHVLLVVETDSQQAEKASDIMLQVNAARVT